MISSQRAGVAGWGCLVEPSEKLASATGHQVRVDLGILAAVFGSRPGRLSALMNCDFRLRRIPFAKDQTVTF
jgi:hypothetical protein